MGKQVIQSELFRVFLLEDEAPLRADLSAVLKDRLPGTRVIAVGTTEEALQILSQQSDFTLGILDIRIPLRRGMQPEADPQVADRLREMAVACLLITAFRESEDVQAYLRNRSLVDPPVAVIEKSLTSGGLIGELTRHVRGWFTRQASNRITDCINELFGPSAMSSGPRSGTAALIEAQQEIVAHWPYLDEAARDLVRRWFVVRELGDNTVTLSLFSADDSA